MLDVMALEKEWCKHSAEYRGKWMKKIWLNIEGLKLYVIIGVWQGIVQDARVFTNEALAVEYEKWLCEQYMIPFDKNARKKYYDQNEVDGEVYNYDVPINLPLPPPVVRDKHGVHL
jgi:hypothetical protein